MLFSRAVIQRRDQRAKAIGNETTTHFVGTREFAIVRVQFFVQDEEAVNLRSAIMESSERSAFTLSPKGI